MIAILLAMAAGAATIQSEAVNNARQAYNDCLRAFMRAELDQGTEPAAFEAALSGQCAQQGSAFTAALVQRDLKSGGKRNQAEEDARMTMEDIRATTVEYFSDYHSTNSRPPD